MNVFDNLPESYRNSRTAETLEASIARGDHEAIASQLLAAELIYLTQVENAALKAKLTEGLLLLVQTLTKTSPESYRKILEDARKGVIAIRDDANDVRAGRL